MACFFDLIAVIDSPDVDTAGTPDDAIHLPPPSSAFHPLPTSAQAVVFVPQSVCLDSVELTRQFVETHVAFQNPSNTDQFASLNGLCCYSTDTGPCVCARAFVGEILFF